MTAKDIQNEFIKFYLKPTLKRFGYQNSGQTWWKNRGAFFSLINLQNYSWNNKDNVDFRFNIGIAVTATVKDPEKKKLSQHDLTVHLSESFFLPANRKEHKFLNNNGYTLSSSAIIPEFMEEMKVDFEQHILPELEKITSLKASLNAFQGAPFWYDNLTRVIRENNLMTSD